MCSLKSTVRYGDKRLCGDRAVLLILMTLGYGAL